MLPLDLRKIPLYLLAVLLAGTVLTLGFAGWMRHAGELVLSLSQQGLSWCL